MISLTACVYRSRFALFGLGADICAHVYLLLSPISFYLKSMKESFVFRPMSEYPKVCNICNGSDAIQSLQSCSNVFHQYREEQEQGICVCASLAIGANSY